MKIAQINHAVFNLGLRFAMVNVAQLNWYRILNEVILQQSLIQ